MKAKLKPLKLEENPSRKHRFKEMFKPILNYLKANHQTLRVVPDYFDLEQYETKLEKSIERDIFDFRRTDRIIYILKLRRIDELSRLVAINSGRDEKLVRLLASEYKYFGLTARYKPGQDFARIRYDGLHYVSNASVNRYVKVLNLEWKRQHPFDLLGTLNDLEVECQKEVSLNKPVRLGETLIDLGSGWKWVLLDRGYCELEGAAMGHCGNAGNYDSKTRIISLRETNKKSEAPHLTFILHGLTGKVEYGFLGETKGRFNSKPDKKYHQKIIQLLKHPMILWNQGGGYKPENNFFIKDLTPEQQSELKSVKPGLFKKLEGYVNNIDVMKAVMNEVLSSQLEPTINRKEVVILDTEHRGNFEDTFLDLLPSKQYRQMRAFFQDLDDPTQFSESMVINDRDVDIESFMNYLERKAPERYKKVIQRLKKEHPDLIQEHEDFNEVIKEAKPEWIFDAMRSATYDGWSLGTEASAIDSFHDAINSFGFENGVYCTYSHTSGYKIVMSLIDFARTVQRLLDDGNSFPIDLNDLAGDADTLDFRYESDYDAEAANQSFLDLLEEDKKTNPKKKISTRSVYDPDSTDL